jgi:putative ABC transport system permease protein
MPNQLPWWLQDLWEGWRTTPARVFLTLFAVGTGALTLTLLLAVMSGLREQADRITADFGANTAILELERNGQPVFSREHLRTLEAQFPDTHWVGEREYNGLNLLGSGRITLYAATPGWERARGIPLTSGRALDLMDQTDRSAHALVSSDLNLSPGDTFLLHYTAFTVVGTTGPGRRIQIPDTLRGDWEQSDDFERFHRIRLTHPTGNPVILLDRVEDLLSIEAPHASLRRITPDLLLAETRRLSTLLQRIFGTVTLLSLLLGGATLGSLMIQNVRQRRREIGLRLAIGARETDIFSLFMLEGLLLTAFAALFGLLVASRLILFVPPELGLPLRTDESVYLLPLLTAGLTGLLFSWIPARLAARMAPAQALRCED